MQIEVELVLSNYFEVLCFVSKVQGIGVGCVVGLGVLSGQVDVVCVVFQIVGVGFSVVVMIQCQFVVLVVKMFGVRVCEISVDVIIDVIGQRSIVIVVVLF